MPMETNPVQDSPAGAARRIRQRSFSPDDKHLAVIHDRYSRTLDAWSWPDVDSPNSRTGLLEKWYLVY
jgi:hypothetical protein